MTEEIPSKLNPFLLKSMNDSWDWVKNPNNQKMVITNWEWNVRNIKFGPEYDADGNFGTHFEHPSPIVPVLAVVMLTITVFLLILFRQNPGLVAGTVAGCLIIIGIYLTLNTIKENTLTYE